MEAHARAQETTAPWGSAQVPNLPLSSFLSEEENARAPSYQTQSQKVHQLLHL